MDSNFCSVSWHRTWRRCSRKSSRTFDSFHRKSTLMSGALQIPWCSVNTNLSWKIVIAWKSIKTYLRIWKKSTLLRQKSYGESKVWFGTFLKLKNEKIVCKTQKDQLESQSQAYKIAQKSAHRMMSKMPSHDLSEMGEKGIISARF